MFVATTMGAAVLAPHEADGTGCLFMAPDRQADGAEVLMSTLWRSISPARFTGSAVPRGTTFTRLESVIRCWIRPDLATKST